MRWNGLKFGWAVGCLALALLAGAYLSGWLTLTWLGVQADLRLLTYADYWKALDLPPVAKYVTKIKLSGAVGFGVPLLCWLLLLVGLFRSRDNAFHGDAHFATKADVAQAGLLKRVPEEGIVLGKMGRHYLWLNGAQHVIVIAPTRSGKSTSIAIPVALTYEGSMVVLDVKGELHALTSGYRQQQLHQAVHVWAPYEEGGHTHRFNPLTALGPLDHRVQLGELQTIAAILYPDEPGKDPFWTSQARAAFVAFAAFLFENWHHQTEQGLRLDPNASDLFPSLERIHRLTAGSGAEGVKPMIQTWLSPSNRQAFGFVSDQTRTAFSSLMGMADETFSSVIATVQAPLQQFLSPVLAAATNATDFDLTQLRRQKMTVYVVIPPKKLDEAGKLLNIFFSTVIGGNLHGDRTTDPSIKHQVLTLMDEFTSMGRLDVWAKRISVAASFGVRDLTIVQSRPQLRSVYGAEDAQNFITNHGASVVFTPREQEDAEEYSRALGDRTVRRTNRSISRGAGGSSVSTSHSEERRALMLPQEIKGLPKDEELIFVEGCPPIRCRKNWYFEDPIFKQRLLPKVGVPALGAMATSSGSSLRIGGDAVHRPELSTKRMEVAAGQPLREVRVGMIDDGKVVSALPLIDTRTAHGIPTERGSSTAVHKEDALDRQYDLQLKAAVDAANQRVLRSHGLKE
ncbi:MAG TPA: type IV secretory system conjugative DNA transfer family protein [Stenotrophomonas sp.]|jgi:type IV secretion system protein VirD4